MTVLLSASRVYASMLSAVNSALPASAAGAVAATGPWLLVGAGGRSVAGGTSSSPMSVSMRSVAAVGSLVLSADGVSVPLHLSTPSLPASLVPALIEMTFGFACRPVEN